MVSYYLALSHFAVLSGAVGENLFCRGGGLMSCDAVALHSASSLFGYPLPVWGLLFYLTLLLLGLAALAFRGAERRALIAFGLVTSVLAVLFDLYLAVVMLAQVRTVCLGCVATYAINIALAASYWGMDRKSARIVRWSRLLPSLSELRSGGAAYYRNACKLVGLASGASVLVIGSLLITRPFRELKDTAHHAFERFLIEMFTGTARVDMDRLRGQPSLGPEDAVVTVAVASDFQCEFCRSIARTLNSLYRRFPAELRLVFVNSPLSSKCNPGVPTDLHEDACWLAEAGEAAAAQSRFWEYHDYLYLDLPSSGTREETVRERIGELGVDAERFWEDIESGRGRAEVDRDLEICAELGLSVTPSVVINGFVHEGAMYPGMLEQIVWALIWDRRDRMRADPEPPHEGPGEEARSGGG